VLGSGGRWGKSSGATKPFGATTDVLGGGGGGGGGGGAPGGGDPSWSSRRVVNLQVVFAGLVLASALDGYPRATIARLRERESRS
jgi:hypothetical protein